MMNTILLPLFMLLCIGHYSFAQDQGVIDSLQAELSKHNAAKTEQGKNAPSMDDTTAANILADLSQAYWFSDYEKAMENAKQCLELSEQIAYKKGMGKAYNGMGVINIYKGDFVPALEFLNKALV